MSSLGSGLRVARTMRSTLGSSAEIPAIVGRRKAAIAVRSSESSHAPAEGITDQIGRPMDVDSSHDPGPMGLGGLELDTEERRNLFRLLALRDQLKHLSLPTRQAIERNVGLGQRDS